MLSTLSSFLPSALSPAFEKPIPPSSLPTLPPQNVIIPQQKSDVAVEQPNVKKKKEKSNEAFILVRPPPAKTNHPLNLQIQLVPPHSRDNNKPIANRRSVDEHGLISNSASMDTLSRVSSNRSEVSDYSSYSNSQSSISSVGSTSSGRRMIIPLYNLQAHNVMTNLVVDAGTDAKIARFMKRGLEMIGLAVIEPMEVWSHSLSIALPLVSAGGSNRNSYETHDQNTPGSSATSLPSTSHHPYPLPPSIHYPTTPMDSPSTLAPPNPHSKKFFGKLFKKKDGLVSAIDNRSVTSSRDPSPSPHPISDSDTSRRHANRSSSLAPSVYVAEAHISHPVVLQSAVLGIQPTLNAPSHPPRGRPTAYVWTVTRWLKNGSDTLLGGVKGIFGNDRQQGGAELTSMVEVRWEWRRGKSSRKKSRRDRTDDMDQNSIQSPITPIPHFPSSSSLNQAGEDFQRQRPRRKRSTALKGRPSIDSHRSQSPKGGGSTETNTTGSDDGEQSDPEDSETPWTCNVIVQPIASSRSPYDASAPNRELHPRAQQQVKIKVATISPTPHHPKVVSLLKIPFPLPDIEVEQVRARKREVGPVGVAKPQPLAGGKPTGLSMFGSRDSSRQVEEGLILTAEEIKDVVASTAFWLVVREGMGGVGKVSRKGDGWRLRG